MKLPLTWPQRIKKWADASVRPFSYAAFAIAAYGEYWLLVNATPDTQKLYLLPGTILLTGIMATCGWMWSGHINRKLQRKSLAITILLALRADNVNTWKKSVYDYINAPEANKPELPLEDALKLLGLYEMISVAVMNGSVDENIIKESQRKVFLNLYLGLRDFIKKEQETDKNFYCHLVYYAVHWNEGAPRLGSIQYVKQDGDFLP